MGHRKGYDTPGKFDKFVIMISRVISVPGEQARYNLVVMGEYEYANPIEKIGEGVMQMHMMKDRSIAEMNQEAMKILEGDPDKEGIIDRVVRRRAQAYWQSELDRIMQVPVESRLIRLLTTEKKREQIGLLRGVTINPEKLMAFIFRAWTDHGFTYSVYESHSLPTGVNWSDVPEFAYKDETDGSLFRHGSSTLDDGKLRAVIEDRKVVVAKFLDKGPLWHCFFLTYKSLAGKERGEMPHLHYVSPGWGMDRAETIRRLKEQWYSISGTPHISYSRSPGA